VYETGTAVQVRAFHVMPGLPPPEGERHAHDYRLDVVVRREQLDERGMVVDLDLLDQALRDAAAQVEDVDLERIQPAGAGAVTVEVFARWLHGQLAGALGRLPEVTLGVRVWETATAFGGYTAPL
jgi:6-pyruvoyltetrahydropterin/6-carboxytetrahydropterin synthase